MALISALMLPGGGRGRAVWVGEAGRRRLVIRGLQLTQNWDLT
jgi:hypothetical protein